MNHPRNARRISTSPCPGSALVAWGTSVVLGSLIALVGCNRSEPAQPVAENPAASGANDAAVPPSTAIEAAAPSTTHDDAPLWPPSDSTPPFKTQFTPLPQSQDDQATLQPAGTVPLQPAAPPGEPGDNPLRPSAAAAAPRGELNPPGNLAPPNATQIAADANPEEDPPPASASPKKREPLFQGWENPRVVLLLTGQQQGYIEPCGCTGLANQKGGLARRHTLVKQLADKGWEVVPVDVGNQVRRYGKQSEIKFARTAEGLRAMNYAAVTLGVDDLRLPADALLPATNHEEPSIFVSANIALLARELQPTTRVIEAGGKKIGITGVLGPSHEKKLQGSDVVHTAALESLQAAARELQAQQCDYYVLLSHASLDETTKLATAVPIFDLVVTAGGYGEPKLNLDSIDGTKSQVAQVGTKAMYAVAVGLFDDPANPVRYERVPLDDRFEDSPEMLQLLADYQKQLQQMGLEELGVRQKPHPSGRTFVGSDTCGNCHTKAFAHWQGTPHAHATDSLVRPPNSRGDIPRHYDPECLSCHVTGWEPQQYYPFESGYLSLTETPLMQHNGCENCHGPGSAHVAAENGEGNLSDAQIAALRNEMKLPLAGGVAERKCMECHDLDNSPDFHEEGAFAKYWKVVEHRGKD